MIAALCLRLAAFVCMEETVMEVKQKRQSQQFSYQHIS